MATMVVSRVTMEEEARMDEARRRLKAQLVASEPDEIEPLRVATEAARVVGLDADELHPAEQLLHKLQAEHAPLTFTDIPRQEMERLQAVTSRDQAASMLVQSMGLDRGDAGFRAEVLVEYHYHNFAFCQKCRFNAEKASTFLSIMKALHTRSIVEDKSSETEARTLFETLVARHSRQSPPYKVGVFTQGEVDLLRSYAERSFFRHYKMYMSIYGHRQDLLVRVKVTSDTPEVPARAAFTLADEINPQEELVRLDAELQVALADGAPAVDIQALERAKMALQIGDLADLFYDPAAEAAKGAVLEASSRRGSLQATPEISDEMAASAAHKDDVAAAIDEVMQGHLTALDEKLKLPDL